MIYTFQKRRALNKVMRSLFPETEFHEEAGVPMMYTYAIPAKCRKVESIEEFLRLVDESCSIDECGTRRLNPKSVLPIFIEGKIISGDAERMVWRVNYVMCTEYSKRRAAEYVEKGKVFV